MQKFDKNDIRMETENLEEEVAFTKKYFQMASADKHEFERDSVEREELRNHLRDLATRIIDFMNML